MEKFAGTEIYKTLKRRFFFSRLLMVLIPLGFCAIFSAAAGFLLVKVYAEKSGGDLEGAEVPLGDIFAPHGFLLAAGGLVFLCFLTGMIFLIQALLCRRLARLLARPLDALAGGFDRWRAGEAGVLLKERGGVFRPMYRAFNAASPAPESPESRPSLERIRGALEGIEGAAGSASAAQKKYLGRVLETLAPLKHLLDEMLLLADLEREDFPINRTPLELGRFFAGLREELVDEYRSRGLRLHLVENREPLRANLDAPWLRNALVHLFDNSARYKRLEEGTVVVSYRRQESGGGEPRPGTPALVEITVADNGPGLPPEALPGLFDYRGPGGLPQGGGQAPGGLGLAITGRIVRRLGGGIYAEQPGRNGGPSPAGLRVILCFPLEQPDTGAAESGSSEPG